MKTIDTIRKAFHAIHEYAMGKSTSPYMSIPADPNRDADLIVSAAIDELEQLRADRLWCVCGEEDGLDVKAATGEEAIRKYREATGCDAEEEVQAFPITLEILAGRAGEELKEQDALLGKLKAAEQERDEARKALEATKAPRLLFPIQRSSPVPWVMAERAYDTYARFYGTDQSLQRLADRGGFGLQEFACLFHGHEPLLAKSSRNPCTDLRACVEKVDAVGRTLAALTKERDEWKRLAEERAAMHLADGKALDRLRDVGQAVVDDWDAHAQYVGSARNPTIEALRAALCPFCGAHGEAADPRRKEHGQNCAALQTQTGTKWCEECDGDGRHRGFCEKLAPAPASEAEGALSLAALREANEARQKEWDRGEQITLLYRATELGGEVGEALNVVKKLERERLGIPGSRATLHNLANELADVVICVDLLAMQAGIDLSDAVVQKFNTTSGTNGLKTRLGVSP